MENTLVLLIIVIIIVVALLFFMLYQKGEHDLTMMGTIELESMKKFQEISFIHELQCSENNVVRADCYDIDKIIAFKEILEANPEYVNYYKKIFGQSVISFAKYNPSPETKSWDQNSSWQGKAGIIIYNNPITDYRAKSIYRIPVTLRDSIKDIDYFGVLSIEVYG